MKHAPCSSRCGLFGGWFLLTTTAAVSVVTQMDQLSFGAESPRTADETQKQVYSGLQPGETTNPFTVLRVTDDKLKELEIVKNADEGITLICFVHRLSNDDRILFGLGLVDFYAARYQNLRSHFVLLSDERDKIEKMLLNWNRSSLFKKSLVSLSVDGAEGPGYYGLNRNVAMTVLVVKGNRVLDNLVLNAPNYRDLESIMVLVANALEKPKPKLAKVQQELREERQRQLDRRIKASPVFKLSPNEELGQIMYGLVNGRGNRSKNAQRRSQQLMDWAGDSEARKNQLQEYCKSVLDGDFKLDQYSRVAIQKLAQETGGN
jgi:hypothetical protein